MKPAGQFILTAITREPELARAADSAGVDRIGIDIEQLGKAARQRHLPGARISDHQLDDLAVVAANVTRAVLFIRVNPLHSGTKAEVERALQLGARVLMLPFFAEPREVSQFVEIVGGRADAVALVETASAAARIRDIAAVPGLAEIMVGLNDLHADLHLANHFQVVVADLMGEMAARVRDAGLRFGFGGIARVDDQELPVPPDLVYAQYPRLGATAAWVSRSFYRGLAVQEIPRAVDAFRQRMAMWFRQPVHVLCGKRDELAVVACNAGTLTR